MMLFGADEENRRPVPRGRTRGQVLRDRKATEQAKLDSREAAIQRRLRSERQRDELARVMTWKRTTSLHSQSKTRAVNEVHELRGRLALGGSVLEVEREQVGRH